MDGFNFKKRRTEMSQICTNEKQSRRLLIAGIPHDKADMYILRDDFGREVCRSIIPGKPISAWDAQDEGHKLSCSCAFSLSRLWDMLSDSNITLEYATNKPSEILIEYLVTMIERFAKQGRI